MKRYALAIGIGQYQHLKPLSKPAIDAAAVQRILQERGDFSLEIPLLVDGQATQKNVQAALRKILTDQGKGAEVLIYFTGHGFVAGESEYEQKGYLATYDCEIKQAGDSPEERLRQRILSAQRGISFEFLNGLVGEAELAGLAVLLDCCHSEWFIDQALVGRSLKVFEKSNYFLSAACRSFEVARAKQGAAHSVYSGALLAALGDQAAGRLTVLDVHNSIVKGLAQSRQEPISFGFGTGFVLVDDRVVVQTAIVDDSIEPYQGLNAFTPETKQFFFGRDEEVLEILRKLQDCNFVPVIGPSGIGKSSIVRAGLIPRLVELGWRILGPIKPGPDPVGELKRSFREVFPERRLVWVYEQIEAGDLGAVVAELPGASRFLLVIDQFEEVFTLCREAVQADFVAQIVAIGHQSGSRLAIVTTMRSDFITNWLATGQRPQVIKSQTVYVGPLLGDGLWDAIVKPAELLGYKFGEGLLELILADVESEPNSLPLLEFALSELWGKRDAERWLLTAAAYREMGGLKGSLNTCSEMLYASLPKPEQEWVQQICLQLVRIGKGEADTRQRRPMADLLAMGADAAIQQTIEAAIGELVRGRLLVTDGDESGKIVDLAHEALMRGWERLALWRQENRDQQRLKQRIEDDYEAWIFHQKSNDYLLPKGLLQELKRLASGERNTVLISAELCDFFRLSEEYQQRTTSLSQAGAMSELLEEKANILELSPDKRVDQVLMSIALIDKSMHHFQRVVEPVQEMLDYARKNLFECLKIEGHTGIVFCVAINPAGDRIISGSEDGTLRLWNFEGQQIGEPFQGHSAAVRAVAFSPNGEWIVSGSSDSTLRLWDLNGTPIGEPFQGHLAGVLSVAVSPMANRIISGSADATLRLWDLEGWVIQSFHGHSDRVLSVAFSPIDDRIISASDDGTLRLWDLDGTQVCEPFQGCSDGVLSVAFSPVGDRIVSGSADTTLRLWDLNGSQIGEPFQGHSEEVLSVSFSPLGDQIVSGSDDGTLRLCKLQGQEISFPLQGHLDGVLSVAFDSSGNYIVSGSADTTLRLWDLNKLSVRESLQGALIYNQAPMLQPVIGNDCGTHAMGIITTAEANEIDIKELKDPALVWLGREVRSKQWADSLTEYVNALKAGGYERGMVNLRSDLTQMNPDGTLLARYEFTPNERAALEYARQNNVLIVVAADNNVGLMSALEQASQEFENILTVGVVDESARISYPNYDLRLDMLAPAGTVDWPIIFIRQVSSQNNLILPGSGDDMVYPLDGNTWRDWLHDCCNKLMFHSDLVSPKTPFAHQACDVCKTQAWTRLETARFLRAQAHALARQGHLEEAAAKMAEAQHLDPQ